MKKISIILSAMLSLLCFTACGPDMEYTFDTTASERVELYKKNVLDVLKSADEGWRVEYFTGYGGYNMFMKFSDNSVTVAGEKIGPNHTAGVGDDGLLVKESSHYKVEQSQGVILSFDGNNELLHYLSTPQNPDFGQDGEGLEGDFEFRVQHASADSVILIGRKHMAKVRMFPVEKGMTWEQYVDAVNETADYMNSRSYTFEIEGNSREINVSTSYRIMTFEWKDDQEQAQKVSALYIVTKEGFKFYRSYLVDSCSVEGFAKGDTQEYFYMMNGTNGRLWTYVPTLAESLQSSSWFILYNNLGEYAQPQWEAMRLKLKTSGANKTSERLYWAILGTYNKKCGLHMQAGSNYALQGIDIKANNEEGTEVTMKRNTSVKNSNGTTYYNKFGMDAAMEPFVGKRGRTFKLTTDNQRKPTYMLLEDVDEPTNVIRLQAEEAYYVYGELDNYDNE